jgi:RNA polymerase sigma factor (TIGR02999 family)
MSEVTRLLGQIERGDGVAAEQLFPLVYDELRKLAAARLAQERPGQTLQATALVHEVYLRLVDGDQPQQWAGVRHFFAAAAESMRRILVDRARARRAAKRGGGAVPVPLDEAALPAAGSEDELLAIHDVIDRFATVDPAAAELVKLRFFAGLTAQEAADALGLSVRSAHDLWAYARAWLHRELRPAD